MDGSGGDGEEAAGKVDAASTDLISQAEERCTTEVADSHESVDDAERGTLVLEAKVIVPVGVGVDTADYTPIDTVAVPWSVPVIQKHVRHQGYSPSLVDSHDKHDEAETKAGSRPELQSLSRLGDQVVLGDASRNNLLNGNASLCGIGVDILVDVVLLNVCNGLSSRHGSR